MLLETNKPLTESNNVAVSASEVLENSEMSDCSLDITCSTVTQSASSPSESDQENSTPSDGLTTVSKAEEAEINEMLSDCSTVSAENSYSTVSVPSSSEMEQDSSSRKRLRGLAVDAPHRRGQAGKTPTITKKSGTNSDMSSSSAVCQPGADSSNNDQIVISASNRVQNYLASLGLPGLYAFMWLDF